MAKVSGAPASISDEALFDSRTVDRHIKEGRTTQAAFDQYMAALPDESEECVQSDVRFLVRGRMMASTGGEDDEQ